MNLPEQEILSGLVAVVVFSNKIAEPASEVPESLPQFFWRNKSSNAAQ